MADPNELTAEEIKMMEAGETDQPITEEDPSPEEGVSPEPEPTPVIAPPPPLPPKTVPLAALHEAREEIRQMRQQLGLVGQLKDELMQMRERLKPEAPTFDTDPKAALQNEFASLKEQIAQRDRVLEQLAQTVVGRQQQEDLVGTVRATEHQFRQTTPDYDDAVNYIMQVKARELQALGVSDPNDINQRIVAMAWQFSQGALQKGLNPAESVYGLAQAYGYAPKAVTPQAQTAVPQQVAPKAGQQRFETIQQGQQVARTLQAGVTEADPTVKALLEADDEEFNRMWDKVMKPKKGSY